MTKYGTDERGWPLVPVDPKAIPDGYEAVRVGWPKAGETSTNVDGGAYTWFHNVPQFELLRLIIRPIPKPIRLPLAIVPEGWWVARNEDSSVWVFETQPPRCLGGWGVTGQTFYRLPPWIAAELPREWHELPWDQSAVQQQEGGEG